MRIFFILIYLFPSLLISQHKNPYNLAVIENIEDYKKFIASQPEKKMVEIKKEIPSIILDLKYATKDNFTHTILYNEALAFAPKKVTDSLKIIQAELQKKGLGIKIFDAYRPYKITVKFYNIVKNLTYVASPKKGSRHNRGCALDITLVNLKTGKELKMPTKFDAFTPLARPKAKIKDPEILNNRNILIQAMEKHGFKVNASEWWHFDFKGYQQFPLLDIDFKDLQAL